MPEVALPPYLVRVRLDLHDVLLDLIVPLESRLYFQEVDVLVAHFRGIKPRVEGQESSVASKFAVPGLRITLLLRVYGRVLNHVE